MNKISENKVKELISELKTMSSFKDGKRKVQYWYNQKNTVVNANNISTELIKEFLDEYNRVKKYYTPDVTEDVETDERAIINVSRDENGRIEFYTFQIFIKNKAPFEGELDRKEMETIYRLYSTYGANLTQKLVSRNFPQYTFIEFKRILRAFNIYKCNSEFPPHMLEEKTEEELIQLHNQNKENNVLRRIEKDQLSEANKLINKLAKENLQLKEQFSSLNNIKINLKDLHPIQLPKKSPSSTSLSIYLSDMHIGAKCESYTLYPNEWNVDELNRRLNELLRKISEFGHLDTLIINLLGDNLDGMNQETSRGGHIIPQNMDNMEQIEVFINVMMGFIANCTTLANNIKIYSVKDGNHDGIAGYLATLALQKAVTAAFPGVEFTLFKEYFGVYSFKEHINLICHGKDDKFMTKGMPLNMNDKTQVMIYEYLESRGIHADNIHVIKGDLHSNALNSCKRFDYRNVLSLFGASDYSGYNFSQNAYGVSYDLFIGDIRTIGTFENL